MVCTDEVTYLHTKVSLLFPIGLSHHGCGLLFSFKLFFWSAAWLTRRLPSVRLHTCRRASAAEVVSASLLATAATAPLHGPLWKVLSSMAMSGYFLT